MTSQSKDMQKRKVTIGNLLSKTSQPRALKGLAFWNLLNKEGMLMDRRAKRKYNHSIQWVIPCPSALANQK
jgi:hypothetical protein